MHCINEKEWKKGNLFEQTRHIAPSWELNALSWSAAHDNLRMQTLIDCLLLSHGGLKFFRFDCEDSGTARPCVGVNKLKKREEGEERSHF